MSQGKYTTIGLAGAVFLLFGCAEYRLDEFDHMTLQGTDFDKTLARGYADLARMEERNYDTMDASYFAGKAIEAGKGRTVMPENPTDWNICPEKRPELMQSHQRLINALQKGARNDVPIAAAEAQVFQDCWIEETDEGWGRNYTRMCRDGFMEKMAIVESIMNQEESPAFVVLFNLDSAVIDAEGMRVIDKAVQASRTQQGFKIHVLGRTDRIGKKGYNQNLSFRRAEAVKQALIARGIPVTEVQAKGLGETPGKRIESENRRADILWVK